MSESPRPKKETDQTTKSQSDLSAPMVLMMTALDTTWRTFVPVIGGTFLGIGIDHLFNIAPIGTIVCLALGVALSGLLIVRQLKSVQKSRK